MKQHSTLDVLRNKAHPLWLQRAINQSAPMQKQKDVFADDSSEIAPITTNQEHIIAAPEFNEGILPFKWVDTETGVEIAYGYGSWLNGVGSGMFLTSRAKSSLYYAATQLLNLDEDDDIRSPKTKFVFTSRGDGTLDMTGATNDAAGQQYLALIALLNETNVTNTVSYLTARSKGTAAAAFGVAQEYRLESAGGNDRPSHVISSEWADPTDSLEFASLFTYKLIGGAQTKQAVTHYVNAQNTLTVISTSGQTTVFSITLPAKFFSATNGGHLGFRVMCYFDMAGTGRNVTPRLTVGGTTFTGSVSSLGSGSTWVFEILGEISRNTTDSQECTFRQNRFSTSAGTYSPFWERTSFTNDDDSTIAVTLTLQLSGAVDLGYFFLVDVWPRYNADTI